MQKNVVTGKSKNERSPPGVPVSDISSPLGVRVPVAASGDFGKCSNEGLASKQTLELALSSAEAELCGIVKATTEALGIQSVGRDLGLSMTLSIPTQQQPSESVRELALGRSDTLWLTICSFCVDSA